MRAVRAEREDLAPRETPLLRSVLIREARSGLGEEALDAGFQSGPPSTGLVDDEAGGQSHAQDVGQDAV